MEFLKFLWGQVIAALLWMIASVKCWGRGINGRLGNGAVNQKTALIDVHTSADNSNALSDIASLGIGGSHSCVITNDGTVKCWGEGNNGQLGNGATTDSSYPVDVLRVAENGQSWHLKYYRPPNSVFSPRTSWV